jgi:hypothetical protein
MEGDSTRAAHFKRKGSGDVKLLSLKSINNVLEHRMV